MKKYEYQPLKDGEIRLLRLHPTQPGSPLTGEIFHYLLENPIYHARNEEAGTLPWLEHKLKYEAISYHWGGDARTPFQVILDDGMSGKSVIKITKTLNSVLRRLVSPGQERIVWADAICINQVNAVTNVEKGKQIQLMPDIYRIASCVQVYLGDASDDSELAIDLLEKIAEYSEDIDDSWAEDSSVNGYRIALSKGMKLPDRTNKAWPALRTFLRRPWFKRIWILQEFVYATDIQVRCGDRAIDWRHLWLASKAYVASSDLVFMGYEPKNLRHLRLRTRCLSAYEDAKALHTVTDLRMRAWGYMTPQYIVIAMADKDANLHGVGVKRDYAAIVEFEKTMGFVLMNDRANGNIFTFGRPGLIELLYRTAKFQATHDVDRLFALLNIAENSGDLKPVYAADYPIEKVQTDWAKHLVENGEAVQVISRAGIRSQNPKPTDPPSWVPNWSEGKLLPESTMPLNHQGWRSRDTGNTLTSDTKKEEDSKRPPAAERLYSAAGDSEVNVRVSDDVKSLITRAIPIDIIQNIVPGRLLLGTPFYAPVVNAWGDNYQGKPMEAALWRTLIANRTHLGEKPGDEYTQQYLNFKQREVPLQHSGMLILMGLAVVAFPIFVFAMRKTNQYIQFALLGLLIWRKLVPLKEAVVYGMCLPLMQYLPLMVLLPLLLLAAYKLGHMYLMNILMLWTMIGVSGLSITETLPDCAGFQAAYNQTGGKYELARTQRMSYLALVPLLAQPGDVICAIMGFDAPIVLRATPTIGEYRIVGEAYVHGAMEGQVMGEESIEIGLV